MPGAQMPLALIQLAYSREQRRAGYFAHMQRADHAFAIDEQSGGQACGTDCGG